MSTHDPMSIEDYEENPDLLSWQEQDIENRLGVPGGRFTSVNVLLSAVIGLLLTGAFYLCISMIRESEVGKMFMERGVIPYCIVFFSAWSLSILFIKWSKIRYQRRTLKLEITQDPKFILNAGTVSHVMAAIRRHVDDPNDFILFNRIVIALSNLRNLGRVSDVDDILRSQASNDESRMESSYSLLRGFVWAIPVLGFIGTVLGLSEAIGQFGTVLQSADDIEVIKTSLGGVTGGLATAFQTTLEALVAALFIQLLMTFVKKKEEEFLDECFDYCLRNVVGRLQVIQHQQIIATPDDKLV